MNHFFTIAHEWDAEDASFTYDANGNMKTNTSRGVQNISYDTRNLPLSMQLDDGLESIYRYNSGGWRTLKKVEDGGVTSVEEHYIMDGGTVLAVTDANGNVKHWNMYGNGLIGRLEDSGTKKYYVRDHLGSTRQVINDGGTQLEYYDYYPFGLALRSDVAGQETKETFTGKEQGPSTGYYYFGSRYYDVALAGWGTTDPPNWHKSETCASILNPRKLQKCPYFIIPTSISTQVLCIKIEYSYLFKVRQLNCKVFS